MRYIKFESIDQEQSYLRYDEETNLSVRTPPPVPTAELDNATIEQLISNTTNWTNQMVGGQLGLRWFKQKGHWNLSSEVRAFVFQNFQSYSYNQYVEDTYYDGTGVGSNVLYVTKAQDGVDKHTAEFVVGTEIRAQAAYAISRALALRAGIEFMEFGRGVARGDTFRDNSEDVVMIGYTFGVDLNR
jgi:hypothetical protein